MMLEENHPPTAVEVTVPQGGSEFNPSGIPDGPDGYRIRIEIENMENDPEVNARLHAAGFTQEQAQLVYDLAAERLGPALEEALAKLEAHQQMERLKQHFGQEKWGEISRQMTAWGKANLAPEVFSALAASYEGVLTLYRMMTESGPGEPGIGRAEGGPGGLSLNRLREMMNDPRYWRDHDQTFVAEVTRGFERLYPR